MPVHTTHYLDRLKEAVGVLIEVSIMPMFTSAAAIAITALIIGIASIFYLGNDNPVEQTAEAVILKEVGVTIDISPDTPAKS